MSVELLFIYNAKSGTINTLLDFSHKLVSPSTYACSLCSLTYGNFGVKKEWQDFLNAFPVKTTFAYKNQFLDILNIPKKLPTILLKLENGHHKEIITADELKNISTITQLINEIKTRTLAFQ